MADLDPKKYQQVAALLKEIRRGYAELKQSNPFDGQTARGFIDAMGDADDAIIKLVDGADELDKKLDSVGKNAKTYFEILIGMNGAIKKQNESLNITKRATQKIQGIAEQMKDDQEGITRLNSKQLTLLKQKYQSQLSSFKIANRQFIQDKSGAELTGLNLKRKLASLVVQEKITQEHADLIAEKQAETSVLNDINNKLISRLETEEKIKEHQTLTNKLLGDAGGLLKNLGLGNYANMLKGLNEEANEFTEELLNQQESAKAYNAELKEAQKNQKRMGDGMKKVLSDSDIKAKVLGKTLQDGAVKFKKEMLLALDVALFKGFKGGIKTFSEAREGLANSFALGRDDANDLKSSLNGIANNSLETHFNIADAVKGLQDFNAEIGGAVKLTKTELQTFSLLSNEFGLTNEQASQFVASAKLRGKDTKEFTEQMRGQVLILAEQEGIAVNQAKVFSDIGSISTANRLTMEGQGKSLANAAFQAAKLGMSQAQLEKVSSCPICPSHIV